MCPPDLFHQPPYQTAEPTRRATSSRDSSSTGAPHFDQAATRRSAIFMRPGECTGWIQPVCSASASRPSSRTRSNKVEALSRSSATKRSPAAP